MRSRSNTLETKDAEQVDVDSIAVEDVDAGQDVLNSTALVRTINTTVRAGKLGTYDQTTSGAGVLLRRSSAFPAVLQSALVLLALNASRSTSLQISGRGGSGAGDRGGNEKDLGELHVYLWVTWITKLLGLLGCLGDVDCVKCDEEIEKDGYHGTYYISHFRTTGAGECDVIHRGIA
jgi:hypothetical protein